MKNIVWDIVAGLLVCAVFIRGLQFLCIALNRNALSAWNENFLRKIKRRRTFPYFPGWMFFTLVFVVQPPLTEYVVNGKSTRLTQYYSGIWLLFMLVAFPIFMYLIHFLVFDKRHYEEKWIATVKKPATALWFGTVGTIFTLGSLACLVFFLFFPVTKVTEPFLFVRETLQMMAVFLPIFSAVLFLAKLIHGRFFAHPIPETILAEILAARSVGANPA